MSKYERISLALQAVALIVGILELMK